MFRPIREDVLIVNMELGFQGSDQGGGGRRNGVTKFQEVQRPSGPVIAQRPSGRVGSGMV